MEAATLLALISSGLAVLRSAISVGKEITPQIVTLFNALVDLISGNITDEKVNTLRVAILALSQENDVKEQELLGEDNA